jgi:hypothetical protein
MFVSSATNNQVTRKTMTITDTETQIFEDSVDHWVLDAITSGVTTFEQLVTSLPGVYPSIALNSLRRLASAQRILTEVMEELVKPAKSKSEPQLVHITRFPCLFPIPLTTIGGLVMQPLKIC